MFMNSVSELINNRRKLVREVACLTAEGRLLILLYRWPFTAKR